ncbi:glycosyltransferase family 2 protein [Zhongshania sp.]|uniref:glycosyltransferase family 2 protein n=1 Tax=Zhongshania sp. TaxID=1971902 RepID=UPI0035692051
MTLLDTDDTLISQSSSNVNGPKVSVVIPMYNAAAYLQDCLDSVLAQTFRDFEVICVDDGSPDNCAEIIKACDDERVRLVQQLNRGLAGARNTGVRHSKGEYVAFLDSDDRWGPRKLERHVDHLDANPNIGVSYSASQFMNDDGEDMGIGQHPKCEGISAQDIFCRNPVGNGSAPVIRRETLNDIKFTRPESGHDDTMYFDESFRQSEDVECWLRIALSTKWKFAGLSEALTWYRVNGEGLSANWRRQLESWERSVENNRKIDPVFIAKWEGLARAYQYRYLARRAVQSRDSESANTLLGLAYKSDSRILLKEFTTTAVTTVCTILLAILPINLYDRFERKIMAIAAKRGK